MLRQLLRKRYLLVFFLLLVFTAIALLWPASDEMTPDTDVAPLHIEPPIAEEETYEPGKVSFSVQAGDVVTPHSILGVYLMPGEELPIEVFFTEEQSDSFMLQAETGQVESVASGRWLWTAPREPGLYRLSVTNTLDGEAITLNAFVKRPFDHQTTRLNGFDIGRYEATPYQGNPTFERPRGFIEVTPDIEDAHVSPNFQIGQFLSKQESGYPKYLVLQEPLLLKLERILEEVNQRGIEAPTLHVMSGFRTPYYNRLIGNTTSYSQHLYGGAADIFVDTEGNGRMDDLTGSGSATVEDARLLAGIVEELTQEARFQPLIGGLGIYGPAPHRGPFIHVDVRGEPARW